MYYFKDRLVIKKVILSFSFLITELNSSSSVVISYNGLNEKNECLKP